MRIVFLNPVGEFGGAERSLVAWIEATRRAFPAAEITLVVPAEGLLSERASAAGASIEVLPMPRMAAALGDSALGKPVGGQRSKPLVGLLRLGAKGMFALPAFAGYLGRLRKLLARVRPDLIHSNGIKTHLALWAARRGRWGDAKPPVVWHLHDFVGARPLVARMLRRASTDASVGIAVSRAVADDAYTALPGLHLEIVYNVVDLARFSPGPQEGALLDRLAGLPPAPPDTVRIVLIATYARWKGQDIFLDAARLAGQQSSATMRFYIVGGPIYRTAGSQFSREELAAEARELGLADRVGFIDFQPDPVPVYRAADIVTHASTAKEPFGLTIVESAATSRATIVSNAGGAAELLKADTEAITVAPGDPRALAAAILALTANPERRGQLGRNARRAVEQRFAPHELPARVAQLYTPLLNDAPAPRQLSAAQQTA